MNTRRTLRNFEPAPDPIPRKKYTRRTTAVFHRDEIPAPTADEGQQGTVYEEPATPLQIAPVIAVAHDEDDDLGQQGTPVGVGRIEPLEIAPVPGDRREEDAIVGVEPEVLLPPPAALPEIFDQQQAQDYVHANQILGGEDQIRLAENLLEDLDMDHNNFEDGEFLPGIGIGIIFPNNNDIQAGDGHFLGRQQPKKPRNMFCSDCGRPLDKNNHERCKAGCDPKKDDSSSSGNDGDVSDGDENPDCSDDDKGSEGSPPPPPPPNDPPRSGGGRCGWLLFTILALILAYLLLMVGGIHYCWYTGNCWGGPSGDPNGCSCPAFPSGLEDCMKHRDADGTGLPDLVLESIGGSIVSTRHTDVLDGGNFVAHIGGIDTMHTPNKPNVIIQIGNVPGTCWAFRGKNGSVVIRLARPAVISSFHLEHTSKKLSPNGNINSAPQTFQVYGLGDWPCDRYTGFFRGPETDDDYNCPSSQYLLGQYTYLDNDVTMQKFEVQNPTSLVFPMVELRILSNHGAAFTCVYRFRVHGSVQNNKNLSPPEENSHDEDKVETPNSKASKHEINANIESHLKAEVTVEAGQV